MAPQLAPMQPPLGPEPRNSQFYVPNSVTLKVQEHVLSASVDDFTITTDQGYPICTCNAKLVSYRGKKEFINMNGAPIFTVRNKILSLHKSFYGKSFDGNDFQIRGRFKCFGSKSTIRFKNGSDNEAVTLEVIGDWRNRTAEIWYKHQLVAKIYKRTFTVREIVAHKQTVSPQLHPPQQTLNLIVFRRGGTKR